MDLLRFMHSTGQTPSGHHQCFFDTPSRQSVEGALIHRQLSFCGRFEHQRQAGRHGWLRTQALARTSTDFDIQPYLCGNVAGEFDLAGAFHKGECITTDLHPREGCDCGK